MPPPPEGAAGTPRASLVRRIVGPQLPWIHSALVRLLGRGRPGWMLPASRPVATSRPRIGYVFLRYPGFSDSFVRRELRAVRDAGGDVVVLARQPSSGRAPVDPAAPVGETTYFGASRDDGVRFLRRMAIRRPLTTVRLGMFVLGRRDGRARTWQRDVEVYTESARLAAAAQRHGVTHLHAPWADDAAVLSLIASRWLRTRFTVQARASECHRIVDLPALPDRVAHADHVITNSRFNETFLRARVAARGGPPVTVIYNGFDPAQFAPAHREAWGDRPAHVVAVGRLVEQKGFPVLLDALHILRERGMRFSCTIIGGARREVDIVTPIRLRKQMTALRLDDVVAFPGELQLPEVAEALRRADLFVLPCVRARDGATDVTPNSLLEAMAMGLPVVSTTHAAIPEIVDNGVDGLLVPPGDPVALADAMERALSDAALSHRLGEAAQRKVLERFNVTRNVGDRLAVFGIVPTSPPAEDAP